MESDVLDVKGDGTVTEHHDMPSLCCVPGSCIKLVPYVASCFCYDMYMKKNTVTIVATTSFSHGHRSPVLLALGQWTNSETPNFKIASKLITPGLYVHHVTPINYQNLN